MFIEVLLGLEAAATGRTYLRLAVLVALDAFLMVVLSSCPGFLTPSFLPLRLLLRGWLIVGGWLISSGWLMDGWLMVSVIRKIFVSVNALHASCFLLIILCSPLHEAE